MQVENAGCLRDLARPRLRPHRRHGQRDCHAVRRILSYEEHSRGQGSGAKAVSYIEITTRSRRTLFGAGMHPNIVTASLLAIFRR